MPSANTLATSEAQVIHIFSFLPQEIAISRTSGMEGISVKKQAEQEERFVEVLP